MEYRWRRATATVLIALFISLAWGLSQWSRANRAETLLAVQYQRAFFELLGHVKNVEVSLSKGRVAASPGETSVRLTEAWSEALSAQTHLNMLPLAPPARARTSTFLTQAGDFAYALAARVSRGTSLGAEDTGRVAELQEQVGQLAQALQEVASEANRGRLSWREVQRLTSAELDDQDRNPFRLPFTRIEENMMEVPTLLYDGPFSDHVTRRAPRVVPEETIDREEARRIAADFLSLAYREDVTADSVRFLDEVRGALHAFRFEWDEGRSHPVRLDVAQRGGDVIWMIDTREPQNAEFESGEAVKRAQEFLREIGFHDVEPIFPLRAAGRLMVPFAVVQDGIPLYPDQIKMTIALDEGSILTYSAMDYLMNHHPRSIGEPALSAEQARGRLNPALDVTGDGRLVWMMDETLQEYLAYEFPVALGDDQYLVYIDAHRGDELRIEKIVDTEEGLLVM